MAEKKISLKLKVWRQAGPKEKGRFEVYAANDISTDMSFLEMLDVVNDELEKAGKEPIAFDHDCREGICGSCGAVVNGYAPGPQSATTLCQLHMRQFKDAQTIVLEPWRANAFPVIKDLVVDRTAFDRIIQAGGYVTMRTGQAPDAHAMLVPKPAADAAMDAAQCIGCGACVAACPNASASLFTGAKISHLALLPQGDPERKRRALAMVQQMDQEGFGSCSKHYECEGACPKQIKVQVIADMNREYRVAMFSGE